MRLRPIIPLVTLLLLSITAAVYVSGQQEETDVTSLIASGDLQLQGNLTEYIGSITDNTYPSLSITLSTARTYAFDKTGHPVAGKPYLIWSFPVIPPGYSPILGNSDVVMEVAEVQSTLALLQTLSARAHTSQRKGELRSGFAAALSCGISFSMTNGYIENEATPMITLKRIDEETGLPTSLSVRQRLGWSLDDLVNKYLPRALTSLEYMATVPAPNLDTICPQLPEKE